ncbi:MAG: twin-arginine translocase TatA/TatE family subunit [Planctomycetota bacterium]
MSFATVIFLGFGLGTMEMVVIGIVGLLIFGRRLPEVGHSLGKTFFDLRRGMNDIKREMDVAEHLADDDGHDDHYRDHNDHYSDPGRRDDEEIVKEAQAFGEGVSETGDSADSHEGPIAREETPAKPDRPSSSSSESKD